jgi:PPP family 3-phenylpropionic acid transporter
VNIGFLLSAYWFFLMGALGVFFPFYSLYLDENAGLTAGQVGLVMASVPLTGMLVQPLWGLVADRSGRRSRLLALLTTVSAVCYAAMYFAESFRSLLGATMLLSIFATALVPLCVSVCFALMTDEGPHAFGRTRAWGTIGFLFAVIAFPRMLDVKDGAVPGLELMMPATALLAAVAALVALLLPDRPMPRHARMQPGEWRMLFRHGPFLRFLVFILGAYLFLQGPMSLFPLFIRSLGGDMLTVSHLWVVMVILEIPLVAYSGAWFTRLGPRVLLALGIGAGAIRWIVSALATDVNVIYAVQALHGVTVGGLMIGAPYYVDAVVPDRLRSTAQGLLSMVGVSLGGILSNYFTGVLIERVGPRAPALVGGVGALLLLCFLPLLVSRTAHAVLPDTLLAEPLSAEPLP